MLEALKGSGKPLVVVLMNGSALAVNWANEHANAILEPGIPAKKAEPRSRRPSPEPTIPPDGCPSPSTRASTNCRFEDYAMKNRTYRYFEGEPLYPFGYGLSYSKFEYSNMKLSSPHAAGGQSAGGRSRCEEHRSADGDEVAELYISFPKLPGAPLRALRGFTRVHLKAGEQKHVKLTLSPRDLSYVNETGDRLVSTGDYLITVGGGQPGTGAPHADSHLTIQGEQKLPE